jgi:decaprenylphospho-beta-D-erythro-pentofuranosid-2-ulose 2-reductase
MRLLVLGAGSALAQALLLEVLGDLEEVYLFSRSPQETLCAQLQKAGVPTSSFQADAFSDQDLTQFATTLQQRLRPTHVLLAWGILEQNNAPTIALEKMQDLNHTRSLLWIQALIHAKAPEKPLHLLFISSLAAMRLRSVNQAYGTTKAKLERDLRHLFSHTPHAHLLILRPGPVETPMTQALGALPLQVSAQLIARDTLPAWKSKKAEHITPLRWRLLMPVLQRIPEAIWKRLR